MWGWRAVCREAAEWACCWGGQAARSPHHLPHHCPAASSAGTGSSATCSASSSGWVAPAATTRCGCSLEIISTEVSGACVWLGTAAPAAIQCGRHLLAVGHPSLPACLPAACPVLPWLDLPCRCYVPPLPPCRPHGAGDCGDAAGAQAAPPQQHLPAAGQPRVLGDHGRWGSGWGLAAACCAASVLRRCCFVLRLCCAGCVALLCWSATAANVAARELACRLCRG